MIHKLKCWPGPFLATFEGRKTHEVRSTDRAFDVGDILCLEEYIPSGAERGEPDCEPKKGHYTGQQLMVRVTYITNPETFGLPYGLCVMSVQKV